MKDMEKIRLETIRAILLKRKSMMHPAYFRKQWENLLREEILYLQGGSR
ncbi:MAG: hypothetical protein GY765_33610 [bacterium]|nr:hypothetical protein [bacterium]